ncbi:T-cell surface antigen CD2 [Elgaria multicarinata webbii]|uniref:T-cell surface antigen CD2 n=1 Tax=Elgaria multicarinata webbii TaxID=159646 RepID=UPI002FCD18A3
MQPLKMNLGSVFLIKFLVIFSFCLKGAVSQKEKLHGLLGDSVLLPAPKFKDSPLRIRWTMGTTKVLKHAQWNGTKMSKQGPERYDILSNGSLKIDKLMLNDSGDYNVVGYNKDRAPLFSSTYITLEIVDPLFLPRLNGNCSQSTVICVKKSNDRNPPNFKMFRNTEKIKKIEGPYDENGEWKVTFKAPQKTFSGKFKCEVEKHHAEKEIHCSGQGYLELDMYVYLIIGGGAVFLIIFLILIFYCIRKKRAERREREDQRRELQLRNVDEELKYRKLPQPPAHGVPNHPNHPNQQHQALPPPPPHERQPQCGPPQPRPRPHKKSPRHMKEGP